jgi:hypothetical protein
MTSIGGPRASFGMHKFSMKHMVNNRHGAMDDSEIRGEHAELTDCV